LIDVTPLIFFPSGKVWVTTVATITVLFSSTMNRTAAFWYAAEARRASAFVVFPPIAIQPSLAVSTSTT
jgi:hypothetical protein